MAGGFYKAVGGAGRSLANFMNKTGLTNTEIKRIGGTIAAVSGAAGLVGTGVGLYKSLNPNTKYLVVFLDSEGNPAHRTVSAESGMDAVAKVKSRFPGITKTRFFEKGAGDYDAQEYMSSLGNKTYSLGDKFKTFRRTMDSWFPDKVKKAILISFGTAVGLAVIKNVKKGIVDYQNEKNHDKTLNEMNSALNKLTDNYRESGSSASKNTPDEYFEEMSHLMALVLRHSKYNKDEFGKSDILATVIYPFVTLLRTIVISDVHILTGQDTGADRTDFELVFAPGVKNTDEVRADPHRDTIFSHRWPNHGFKTTTLGAQEANELIDDTFRFLSKNPKYLAIRL